MTDVSPPSPSILPLKLDNVEFKADGVRLIKDFTCTFNHGPRSVIIGPNGAGKSLLLRLCHGLIPPSHGSINWTTPPASKHAMVFQRPVMLRRSVEANILYALKLNRVDRSRHDAIIEQVLSQTGLKRLAKKPARVLSFGEQQKLALARAWALKPEVLFLDEPTASLDPSATHSVEQIIDAIHNQGTRIIMTTHDLGQARRLADEVLFIHRGRLLEHAPTTRFFNKPENDLAEAFVNGDLLWWKLGKDNRGPQNKRQKK